MFPAERVDVDGLRVKRIHTHKQGLGGSLNHHVRTTLNMGTSQNGGAQTLGLEDSNFETFPKV